MAEYIEREKLMAFPIRIDHYDEEHGNVDFVLGIECVLEYAQDLPTVDAEPVVRCKDCRWFESVNEEMQWGYCTMIEDNDAWQYDDYCSYGVRKERELLWDGGANY